MVELSWSRNKPNFEWILPCSRQIRAVAVLLYFVAKGLSTLSLNVDLRTLHCCLLILRNSLLPRDELSRIGQLSHCVPHIFLTSSIESFYRQTADKCWTVNRCFATSQIGSKNLSIWQFMRNSINLAGMPSHGVIPVHLFALIHLNCECGQKSLGYFSLLRRASFFFLTRRYST